MTPTSGDGGRGPLYVQYNGDGAFLPLYQHIVPHISYSPPDAEPAGEQGADRTAADGA